MDHQNILVRNEEAILQFWSKEKIYAELVKKNKGYPIYYFMDGPPFPNSANLHFGHILVGSIKSIVLNYQQMNGYNVLNKIGYDTHGLPIEMVVNKDLNVHSIKEVQDLGIDKYNQKCKELINQFSGSWQNIYDRMGRFVKKDDQYMTMDTNFMESVWWAFKELWKKDLVYYGCKIMPYSTACLTPLSNFEAGQNYAEVQDKTIYLKFPIIGSREQTEYLLVWTTTPWTLPMNLVLCVNPLLTYVKVIDHGTKQIYVLGKETLGNVYGKNKPYTIVDEFPGTNLIGERYEQLFNYYEGPTLFQVIGDEFVDKKSGTSIVHLAPAFGEIDLQVCLKNNIITMNQVMSYCPIDDSGLYTRMIKDYQGRFCLDCNNDIISYVKSVDRSVKITSIVHKYPLCPRTDTPLIYKAVTSFFIEVTKIKERMVELNKNINWIPANVGLKRFHNWLEDARDWCVSRNRIFGTPIPVWISSDGEMLCVGSIDELVELANLSERPDDLHKEFMDEVVIEANGKKYYRTPFIFDCWFESGCVPYGQLHYPFEHSDYFDQKEYLSDFISEGIDQTRGWFYTLLVISTALFDVAPFKNVICSGLILDKDNKKFSKRHGNFVPPDQVINRYGSDSLRLYLVGSPAASGGSFKFKENDIDEIHRKLYQLTNCMTFFVSQYQTRYQKYHEPIDFHCHSNNILDHWILARTNELILSLKKEMDQYTISNAIPHIYFFIEDLTNWYLKLNRNRLRMRGCDLSEQNNAMATLYRVFYMFTCACAPFMPFLTESFYQALMTIKDTSIKSVHHCPYPIVEHSEDDQLIQQKMSYLQQVAGMIRRWRDNSKIHQTVRIPIKHLCIYTENLELIDAIKELETYLTDEVNTLQIEYVSSYNSMVKYVVDPNNKEIGIHYKRKSRAIIQELLKLQYDTVPDEITIDGKVIEPEFYSIKPQVSDTIERQLSEDICFDNGVLLMIDYTYDNQVKSIHYTRLFVRIVQDMRKKVGVKPWDKITIFYQSDHQHLIDILNEYQEKIEEDLDVPIKASVSDENIIDENHQIESDVWIRIMIAFD